ncbi:hypothetical protein [Burkholderia plantarii]|uniref:Uncharacterized protein n=1 Tax=Burkholderia plantarii TaxID=41899 RepID=A0A0B6SBB3_BURPL|nr:hypothetical protein [Burkholderia plantarii]AJK49556.1 hypothetical protein BGL_2c14890 [Burkholderia plantarii]WLE62807.1 hypothetical protein GIY62_20690 [Burkholderia plantarii]GLZ16966.1 hypothetical protein Bpla01_04960 [Burkholderia plantarii]
MPNWVITEHSNPQDKVVGYQNVLQAMRTFVRTGGALAWDMINVYRAPIVPNAPVTTLHFANNNFQVDQINGNVINYNYPANMPTFYASTFPDAFPVAPTAVDQSQKTQLLFLFVEAARSQVIQDKFEAAFKSSGQVPLTDLAVLAKCYDHTCQTVGINTAHPQRPLTCADYRRYAATLPERTPDRVTIERICP